MSFATVHPPLTHLPHHSCGLGDTSKARLHMEDALVSDIAALTICDVLRNDQLVHGPLFSVLRDTYQVNIKTVADVDNIAKHTPQIEWLIRFIEPLQSRIYQRHPDGNWNLVRIGDGMF